MLGHDSLTFTSHNNLNKESEYLISQDDHWKQKFCGQMSNIGGHWSLTGYLMYLQCWILHAQGGMILLIKS